MSSNYQSCSTERKRGSFLEEQALLIGRTLGNYELLRVLGQGGMGVVYEAKHKLIGKHVAIKVLASLEEGEAPHIEIVQRLFNEAKVVNQIKHENIIDIFDFGTEGPHPYFVMELLEGRSLVQELQGQIPLEKTKALSIT